MEVQYDALSARNTGSAVGLDSPFDEAIEPVEKSTGVVVPKRSAEKIVQEAAVDFDAFYTQTKGRNDPFACTNRKQMKKLKKGQLAVMLGATAVCLVVMATKEWILLEIDLFQLERAERSTRELVLNRIVARGPAAVPGLVRKIKRVLEREQELTVWWKNGSRGETIDEISGSASGFCEALHKIGEPGIPILLRKLNGEDQAVARVLLLLVYDLGDDLADLLNSGQTDLFLRALAKSPSRDEDVRRAAAQVLKEREKP